MPLLPRIAQRHWPHQDHSYPHTHTHTHTHTHAYTHTNTHTHVCIHAHAHTRTKNTRSHTCARTCTHTHTRVYTHTQTLTHTYAHMRTHTRAQKIHVHTRVHAPAALPHFEVCAAAATCQRAATAHTPHAAAVWCEWLLQQRSWPPWPCDCHGTSCACVRIVYVCVRVCICRYM